MGFKNKRKADVESPRDPAKTEGQGEIGKADKRRDGWRSGVMGAGELSALSLLVYES